MTARAEPVGGPFLTPAMRALAARFERMPPLNLWVRTAPAGVDTFHWHVDIAPRLTVKAGFELSTGIDINVYAPEQAAADLREVLGADFVTVYSEVKETEHDEFMKVISPWEREHLLLHV